MVMKLDPTCLILPLSNHHGQRSAVILEELLRHLGCDPVKIDRRQFSTSYLDRSSAILVEIQSMHDLELFRALRQKTQQPIIIYGEAVSSATWVRGLEFGADGFLNLSEARPVLEERLRALLTRAGIATRHRPARNRYMGGYAQSFGRS